MSIRIYSNPFLTLIIPFYVVNFIVINFFIWTNRRRHFLTRRRFPTWISNHWRLATIWAQPSVVHCPVGWRVTPHWTQTTTPSRQPSTSTTDTRWRMTNWQCRSRQTFRTSWTHPSRMRCCGMFWSATMLYPGLILIRWLRTGSRVCLFITPFSCSSTMHLRTTSRQKGMTWFQIDLQVTSFLFFFKLKFFFNVNMWRNEFNSNQWNCI